MKRVGPVTYLVEDIPAARKKKRFRRFNAHICQMSLFRAREEEKGDSFCENDSVDESDNSSGEEETDEASFTEETPDENMVGASRSRSGRILRQPVRHKDFVRH